MASESPQALVANKLESSGITVEEGKRLGFKALSAPEVARLDKTFRPRPGLLIPYFDQYTGKPLVTRPTEPEFFRLRYLGAPPPGFDDITSGGAPKYVQPCGTGVAAYFPKILEWKSVLHNPEVPLIITEGELKAAKACLSGLPTVGLGGVWSWKSTEHCIPFLPELERVDWKRKNVYMAFDSDLRSNDHVCKALWQLALALEQRGAYPWLVELPELSEGQKTGLDDFLVANSVEDLQQLLHEAKPLTTAQALWKMSEEVLYVRDPGMVVTRDNGQIMSPNAFTSHAYSNRKVTYRVLKANGNAYLEEKPLAQDWLDWPLRAEVGRMTYAPGEPEETTEDGVSALNVWPGWGCEPKKGNVKPFLELIDHLFTGAEKGAKEWFMRWLAYPIQYPGTKLYTASIITGIKQGTGKSLIGITMGKIYGKNFTLIGQAELEASFNDWQKNKQFVLGDEVTGNNRRKDSDMLKKMITQETIRINAKYVPSYEIPDCINYLFTSNHPDAFFLEDDDRRYFVNEVRVDPLPREFYDAYGEWLLGDGPSALFHYMLNHPLADFNPAAHAMRTRAREMMLMDGKSDLGSWIVQLKNMPEEVMNIGSFENTFDLYRAEDLLLLFDPLGRTNVTTSTMSRELRRAGFVMAAAGSPIAVPGFPGKYFCIRNADKWAHASVADCNKYIRNVTSPEPAKPKPKKF